MNFGLWADAADGGDAANDIPLGWSDAADDCDAADGGDAPNDVALGWADAADGGNAADGGGAPTDVALSMGMPLAAAALTALFSTIGRGPQRAVLCEWSPKATSSITSVQETGSSDAALALGGLADAAVIAATGAAA